MSYTLPQTSQSAVGYGNERISQNVGGYSGGNQFNPGQFGSDVGASLTALGVSTQQIAKVLQEKDEEAATGEYIDAFADFKSKQESAFQNASAKNQGYNAINVPNMVNKNYTAAEKEFRQRFSGNRYAFLNKQVAADTASLRTNYNSRSESFAIQEGQKAKEQTLVGEANSLVTGIADGTISNDPIVVSAHMARLTSLYAGTRRGQDNTRDLTVLYGQAQQAAKQQEYNKYHTEILSGKPLDEIKREILPFKNQQQITQKAFNFVAEGESGKKGITAIGYDKKGGTSYGTYQISSKSMPGFIDFLRRNGGEKGKIAADSLSNFESFDTGSKDGAQVDVWNKLVKEGVITNEMEQAYIQKTHVDPVMNAQTVAFQTMALLHPPLSLVLYSTAVQHGAQRGIDIVKKAWEEAKEDPVAFINNIFDKRKTQFGGSTPEVRQSVMARLDKEREEALAMFGNGASDAFGGINLEGSRAIYHKDASDKLALVQSLQRVSVAMEEQRTVHDKAGSNEFRERLRNTQKALEEGKNIDIPAFEEFFKFLGQEEGVKTHKLFSVLKSVAVEAETFGGLDAKAMVESIKSYKREPGENGYADSRIIQEKLTTIFMQHMETRDKDPAGYLIATDEDIAGSFEKALESGDIKPYIAMLQAKAEIIGVSLGKNIVPNDYIERIADFFDKAQSPADKLNAMMQQKAFFGGHWNAVLSGLREQKALPNYMLIALEDGISERTAATLIAAQNIMPQQKDIFAVSATTTSTFNEKVNEAAKNYLLSYGQNFDSEQMAEYREAMGTLATYYISMGYTVANAATRANKELFEDRFDINKTEGIRTGRGFFSDSRANHYIRTPKNLGLDAGKIEDKFDDFTGALKAEDVSNIDADNPFFKGGEVKDEFLRNIRERGYFINTPDNTGVYLLLDGMPVYGADANKLFIPFADFKKIDNPIPKFQMTGMYG